MRPWHVAGLLRLSGLLLGGILLGSHPATPRDLLAVTALALLGLGVALLARAGRAALAAGPLPARHAALREKAWTAAFQRQTDPDAAGRPRPRAPGAAPAAA
jgi:hypothetical protein